MDNVIDYCNELFDTFPKYKKYLRLNNVISDYVLDMYYKKVVPKELVYETSFTNEESISLARLILSSLSDKLAIKFDEYLKDKRISFSNLDFSYTTNRNNRIECVINSSNNISDPINIVHEFLHCIHLEKIEDINLEEYYYYTEIMGLIGDIYSPLYLIKNNKYVHDSCTYISNIINTMAQVADSVISFGLLLDVYKSKKNLSDDSMIGYIKEHDLSLSFLDVFKNYSNQDDYTYHEDARYIFAFPISFIISKDIIDNNTFNKYYTEFNKLPNIKVDIILDNLNIDYIYDENKLDLVMNDIYKNIVDIFESQKVKKLGEL